jgi:hypothetical protein
MSKQKQSSEGSQKLNATQRIEALENSLLQSNQKFSILAEEIDRIAELVKRMGLKLNAVIEAGSGGNLSKEGVSQVLVDNAVKELKAKTEQFVTMGIIEPADQDASIDSDEYFIVGREVDENGNVINPRIQFALKSLEDSLRSTFLTKKIGDLVSNDNKSFPIEIVELYKIAAPKTQQVEQGS